MNLQQLFLSIKVDDIAKVVTNQLESPVSINSYLENNPELADQQVKGIVADLANAHPGCIFFVSKNNSQNYEILLAELAGKGALLIVTDAELVSSFQFLGLIIVTTHLKKLKSRLAAAYNSFPSKQLYCFGVTGTNGKTSMTYLLEHLVKSENRRIGIIGTVEHRVGTKKWSTELTTPDSIELHQRLSDFLFEGAEYLAIEVSSHALVQSRADDIHFNTVIFTNLSHDHLDYHGSMENYFHAKQKLFTDLMWESEKFPRFAIINSDDAHGRKLKVAEPTLIWTYGSNTDADFRFEIEKMDHQGTFFKLHLKNEVFSVKSPLIGQHNVYNVVAAFAAIASAGFSLPKAIHNLESFLGIPGRMQRVFGAPLNIFVDYAHTPDALENSLKTLQKIRSSASKIIVVFGCGGDRDQKKRPIMAEVAEKFANTVILTSDNPRTENAEFIIEQIKVGFKNLQNISIEIDREKAIRQAIESASHDDLILIAGKGHEDYQIIGTEKIHFSDYQMAEKYGVKK